MDVWAGGTSEGEKWLLARLFDSSCVRRARAAIPKSAVPRPLAAGSALGDNTAARERARDSKTASRC